MGREKTKTIGFSVFTLIYFPDVGLYVFPDSHLYLTNYSIKLIYMHNIKTGSMRGLKLCASFVVSTYISRVINENVRKTAKTKTLNFKFMRQMICHFVGYEILNITVYFIFISTHISRVNGENVRKISKNGNLKIEIYESNDISSCRV